MSEHLRHLSKQSSVAIACMPNAGLPVLGRQRRALSALTQRARHRARAVRAGIRPGPRGRMLRYDAGAHGRRRRTPCALPHRAARHQQRSGADAAFPPSGKPASRRLYHHVPFDQEAVLPRHRRAHQRERFEGVPRGDARGALGRLRRYRPRAGPRRRAPARRLHRLRGARRRRRHQARSSRVSRRPPRSRSSSTPPSRPCCRPGSSSSAAARSSTPSTTRTATARTAASRASCRS